MRKRTKNRLIIALMMIIILLIGILIGLNIEKLQKKEKIPQKQILSMVNEKTTTMLIPAVNKEGKGIISELETKILPGSGVVSVNINNVIADYDTQYSARLAAFAASNYTNISLENLDIIYTIKTDVDFIGGPSAGAAMAISTALLLLNKTIDKNVSITGMILENGDITKAGGILEKMKACEDAGVKLFLIPKGSFINGNYAREKNCINLNQTEYCEIRYKLLSPSEKIKLIEVSNIGEAIKYFEK